MNERSTETSPKRVPEGVRELEWSAPEKWSSLKYGLWPDGCLCATRTRRAACEKCHRRVCARREQPHDSRNFNNNADKRDDPVHRCQPAAVRLAIRPAALIVNRVRRFSINPAGLKLGCICSLARCCGQNGTYGVPWSVLLPNAYGMFASYAQTYATDDERICATERVLNDE